MPDIPDAFCIHKTSGRMRLKIPSKKGKKEYFSSLIKQMSGVSGIKKIEANPLSGSVLFIYSGKTESVVEHAEANNIFRLKEFDINSTDLHRTVSATFKGINNRIKSITGGGLDMGALAFLALLGLGIYQISRGNVAAPAWYTAFWYALNIFLRSRPDSGAE